MKAQLFLKKRCLGLLAIVRDIREEPISLKNLQVLRDFSDVFPKDLPGLPLVQEIDIGIDLIPDTHPILILPYRVAPTESGKLKR